MWIYSLLAMLVLTAVPAMQLSKSVFGVTIFCPLMLFSRQRCFYAWIICQFFVSNPQFCPIRFRFLYCRCLCAVLVPVCSVLFLVFVFCLFVCLTGFRFSLAFFFKLAVLILICSFLACSLFCGACVVLLVLLLNQILLVLRFWFWLPLEGALCSARAVKLKTSHSNQSWQKPIHTSKSGHNNQGLNKQDAAINKHQ